MDFEFWIFWYGVKRTWPRDRAGGEEPGFEEGCGVDPIGKDDLPARYYRGTVHTCRNDVV